jgi:hypothetical protein
MGGAVSVANDAAATANQVAGDVGAGMEQAA